MKLLKVLFATLTMLFATGTWAQATGSEATTPATSPSSSGSGYPTTPDNIGNPKSKPSQRDGARLPKAGKAARKGKGASKTTSTSGNSGTETVGEGQSGTGSTTP
jgi:hypothetical protein